MPVSLLGTERIACLNLLRTMKPPGCWFSLSSVPAWSCIWIHRGHAVVLGKSGASRIFLYPGSSSTSLCSLQVKAMEVDAEDRSRELVRKPHMLNGRCWPHSWRSPPCTVRTGKGPQMSSFYRWRTEVQREAVSWFRAHSPGTVSPGGTCSVCWLNSSVWREVRNVQLP